MQMTEATAKTKACCLRASSKCLASECMAWRWAGWLQPSTAIFQTHGLHQWLDDERPTLQRIGFCGMTPAIPYEKPEEIIPAQQGQG